MLAAALGHALKITAFVAAMMVAVEYLNVLTRGDWARTLARSPSRQYILAVLLGATPGCLGAFAVVALYTHRMMSFGGLVAAMIATSGDEAFVMLALFPGTALALIAVLAVIGAIVGVVTDRLLPAETLEGAHVFELHEDDECLGFPGAAVLDQLREPTLARGSLALAVVLLLAGLLSQSLLAPPSVWARGALLALGLFTLFVVLTVPDHFLEEHLWRHVVLQHVPRIFAWTAGALLVTELVVRAWPKAATAEATHWIALGAASLIGVVPESGPHLLFVTLFDEGVVPLSVLVASSIAQDGHGMLPLLAHSRSDFLRVKGINVLVGLVVGALLLALGW
jgi:hypothetical protein